MYSDFRIVKKTMKGGSVQYIIEGLPLLSESRPIAWEAYPNSLMGNGVYIPTIEDARKAKERAMNTIVLSTEVVE